MLNWKGPEKSYNLKLSQYSWKLKPRDCLTGEQTQETWTQVYLDPGLLTPSPNAVAQIFISN